jgi:hypothetical protein
MNCERCGEKLVATGGNFSPGGCSSWERCRCRGGWTYSTEYQKIYVLADFLGWEGQERRGNPELTEAGLAALNRLLNRFRRMAQALAAKRNERRRAGWWAWMQLWHSPRTVMNASWAERAARAEYHEEGRGRRRA